MIMIKIEQEFSVRTWKTEMIFQLIDHYYFAERGNRVLMGGVEILIYILELS